MVILLKLYFLYKKVSINHIYYSNSSYNANDNLNYEKNFTYNLNLQMENLVT